MGFEREELGSALFREADWENSRPLDEEAALMFKASLALLTVAE